MTDQSYLTFQPHFKGQDTILLILDNAGLDWLITNFVRGIPFKIDPATPILPHNCDVFEIDISTSESNLYRKTNKLPFTYCRCNREEAALNAQYLNAMKASEVPCHQYLEAFDLTGQPIQLMATFGEYDPAELG